MKFCKDCKFYGASSNQRHVCKRVVRTDLVTGAQFWPLLCHDERSQKTRFEPADGHCGPGGQFFEAADPAEPAVLELRGNYWD